jgi:hypothetical protein
VHGLARNEAADAVDLASSVRQKLRRRSVASCLPADPAEALSRMATEFGGFAETLGAADVATLYRRRIDELHAVLPDVLARTEILAEYGLEQEVAKRVIDRLEQTYLLQRPVVEDTLFRNLTGLINDIAKQPGRQFDPRSSPPRNTRLGENPWRATLLIHMPAASSRQPATTAIIFLLRPRYARSGPKSLCE